MNAKQRAEQIVDGLASTDGAARKEAFEALGQAPPRVTDRVAKRIVARVRKGAGANAICRALESRDCPRFGPLAVSRLTTGLTILGRTDAAQAVFGRGPDPSYRKKLEDSRAAGSRAGIGARLGSVLRQPWVIAAVVLLAIVATAALSSAPSLAPWIGVGGFVLVVAIVGIDALRRRCPECRTLLAAKVLSRVDEGSQNVSHMVVTWGCVHCEHRWKTWWGHRAQAEARKRAALHDDT